MKALLTRRAITLIVLAVFFLLAIALSITGLFLLQQQQAQQDKGARVMKVGLYEKFELTFPYQGNYSNPNDPVSVDVEAVFTPPSGKQQTIPGFFFQDFTRGGTIKKEILTMVHGSERWKVRYAPSELGTYTYSVTLKDSQGTRTLGSGSFQAVSANNPSFIHVVGKHLQRDNGQQFIPLGINAPWFQYGKKNSSGHQWGDGTYGVDIMYQQFIANGLNFFHLWTCNWNVGHATPFARPNIGCDGNSAGAPQMSQPDSWMMDYMVAQAHIKDIYIMPILKHHNQLVFDDADKIKSRYFVARWGYSTNILAWDFNKEGGTSTEANHGWATFMNSIDPYQHPRTTSQWNHYPTLSSNNQRVYTQVFGDPLMNMVQDHDYQRDCTDDLGSDTSLYVFHVMQMYMHNYHLNKPLFIGESGLTPCTKHGTDKSSYYQNDTHGLILKGEVWGSLMAGLGVYAPWYFDVDFNNGTSQLVSFEAARAYAAALPFVPDSATTFSTYQDTSQATTSNAQLRVLGRKNATFAMFYTQNTTGTWGAIVRDGKTPVSVSGTITLKEMQAGSTFTVRWFNTDSGAVVKTDSVTARSNGLVLTLPQSINQSIAAIVTTG